MANPARIERFRRVLHQRLGHVHCAIESLYHRHNVSAVMRTCDSLGLHHVHLIGDTFKPVKSTSRGAERWLQLHWHQTPEQAIAAIRAAGCAVWVADLSEDSSAPEEIPLDRPVCLWFGAELTGVSDAALAAADGVMTIPMRGFAQSLNVSVAAAMALRTVAERSRSEVGERALLTKPERDEIWAGWASREFVNDPPDAP